METVIVDATIGGSTVLRRYFMIYYVVTGTKRSLRLCGNVTSGRGALEPAACFRVTHLTLLVP